MPAFTAFGRRSRGGEERVKRGKEKAHSLFLLSL
jgi:hypothetical protein